MVDLGELGEQTQGASYMLGRCAGLEIAVTRLRLKSGEFFSKGKDQEAHIYRQVAEELEAMRKEMRTEYDKRYQPQKEAAFVTLEEAQKQLTAQATVEEEA